MKKSNLHIYTQLSKERIKEIRKNLEDHLNDKISEEDFRKKVSENELADYRVSCQLNDYQHEY